MTITINCDICKKLAKQYASTKIIGYCDSTEITAEEILKPKTLAKRGWKFNKKDKFIGPFCLNMYNLVAEALDGEVTAPQLIKNEIEQLEKPSLEIIGSAAENYSMAFPCRYCEEGYLTKRSHWKHEVECAEKHGTVRKPVERGKLKMVQMHKPKIWAGWGKYLDGSKKK